MGWKGTVRSINAAAKRADRNAKKRQRELELRRKQNAKMQELEEAAYEVEVFENYIEIIQSMHKECGDEIDWHSVLVSKEPAKPPFFNRLEIHAVNQKEKYKPSFIDRLFKRVESKIKSFDREIESAKKQDQVDFEKSLKKWQQDCKEWVESIEQAKLLIAGVPEAKINTIKELDPFSELDKLGSSLHFAVSDNSLLTINVNIHGEDIIPNEQKSLLKSGKLSVKKMPVGKFNELYQDYVCSSVLRIAREAFAILPDEFILINATDKLLNKVTGHLEEQNILSVYISRSKLYGLNMESIDPSDSMRNFIHKMSFKPTKGFEAVPSVEFEVNL
ncbi:hypothetical protein [Vibrio mimicus]|uniref:Uncharacterized protein n=1 Tax=Vibrio mimicus TaxID=674 RepID=A0A2J9VJ90_VIBMI|nr:hypothetical protein [Vibrio mimicus]EEW10058.1 hypothetical protein VMD_24540 [Vibrio mimicus VM573]KFE29483.1 hypothetical protein DN31_3822 [Vibrio mimicus]PNM63848.1 hypothetical protein AL544_002545 [Vibrio mimicus]